MVNRDRTDRIPRRDDVPDEGDGRPRRDRRPDRLPRDPTSTPEHYPEASARPWETDPADVDRYIDERAEQPATSRGTRRPTAAPPPRARRAEDSPAEAFIPPSASARSRGRSDASGPEWTEESGPGRAEQGNSPRRPIEPGDSEDEEPFSDSPLSPPRTRRAAARPRSSGASRSAPSLPRPRIPAAIAKADLVNDPLALALIGVATFGLLVMATIMGNRLGALITVLELRFDAAGAPYRWGVPRTLWNLPLLGTMITLMNVAVAWFVSPHDRFASRFCIAAALGIQLLIWVPVIRFLW